eukprot:1279612-Rhodomonas_salina.4
MSRDHVLVEGWGGGRGVVPCPVLTKRMVPGRTSAFRSFFDKGTWNRRGELRYVPVRLLCDVRYLHSVSGPSCASAVPCAVQTARLWTPVPVHALTIWCPTLA